MLQEMLSYSKKYDENLYQLINKDHQYFIEIMNIEKDKENPRKDYEKYSDIFEKIKFFYEPYYTDLMEANPLPFNVNIDKEVIINVLEEFSDTLNYDCTEQEWFSNLKLLAKKYDFAENAKEYKKNRDLYLGHVGDVAEMVRIALTASKQSPNIFYVLRILKKEEVSRRIKKAIDLLR